VLFASGITPRLYAPPEDEELLELGIGFTNIVARPTRRADELTRAEIRAGAAALREKLERYRPQAVAYTGIGVYRWLRGSGKVTWGIQPEPVIPGVIDIVLPSPSGLNRMTFEQLVDHYKVVASLLHDD
jgi:TDG/mug DNA glycosylase family protein